MSTNTIILLILGIVVLVVLILGFTTGWDKLAPWLSGNNVDTIVTACEAACTMGSQYDFCTFERDLKASDLPGDVKKVKIPVNFLQQKKDMSYMGFKNVLE